MKFRLSSAFGQMEEFRTKPHSGIDIAMPEGTRLRSLFDATVERVVDYGDANIGKGVILRLEDGTRAIYGHMNQTSVFVGEKINVGDTIGLSGNTGHSTGAHLHFGLWNDGKYIDPSEYAETLMEISGDAVTSAKLEGVRSALESIQFDGPLSWLLPKSLRESAREKTYDSIIGGLEGMMDVIVDLSYPVCLLGATISILAAIAGWEKGKQYTGLFMLSFVLIRFLLGG